MLKPSSSTLRLLPEPTPEPTPENNPHQKLLPNLNLNLTQRDSTETSSRLRPRPPNHGPAIKQLRSKMMPPVSRVPSNLETMPEPWTQPREISLTSKVMLKELLIGVNKPPKMFNLKMPQLKKPQLKKHE